MATARDDALIEALLVERQGYVLRGLAERVAAVDAAIRAAGGVPPDGPEGRNTGHPTVAKAGSRASGTASAARTRRRPEDT